MTTLDRLLIGDNPFNGVYHRSREVARERARNMTVEKIADIIGTALDSGAGGLVFTVTPKMISVLKHMKETNWNRNLGLYPIFPDVYSLVNESSEKGTMGVLSGLLGSLPVSTKLMTLARGGAALVSSDPLTLLDAYIDTEIARVKKMMPKGAEIRAVFLHEVVTETVLSFRMEQIFREYVNHVSSKHSVLAGFETRNFTRLIQYLKSIKAKDDLIAVMAPFNPLGFQMNPSKELCEASLSEASLKYKIIAMSILASGLVPLEEAARYLSKFQLELSCVVGLSARERAKETFRFFSATLGK